MKTVSRVVALAMAVMVSLACQANAPAPQEKRRPFDGTDAIVQDSLTPSGAQPGKAVSATLKLRAPECVTVKKVGVAVRDGTDKPLDYPGTVEKGAEIRGLDAQMRSAS